MPCSCATSCDLFSFSCTRHIYICKIASISRLVFLFLVSLPTHPKFVSLKRSSSDMDSYLVALMDKSRHSQVVKPRPYIYIYIFGPYIFGPTPFPIRRCHSGRDEKVEVVGDMRCASVIEH